MFGEIIAVGEEVLAGDVVNSNAAYLGKELAAIGVFCRYHTVVGDIEADIVSQLKVSSKRSQVILLCGGLGPTKDDLTKESVAKFLGRHLYKDQQLVKDLEAWFKNRNYQISSNNYKQAMNIQGGTSLPNDNGTAPGVYLKENGVHIFLLPGPPNELQPMFQNSVKALIEPLEQGKIITKTYKLINIGESTAVTLIDDLLKSEEDYILAPYAKLSEVHLKATFLGGDSDLLNRRLNELDMEIHQRLGQYIYSENEKDLMDVIIQQLKNNNLKIACAESCSGGLIADSFIQKAGVSSVFMEGAVTYSNQSKQSRLGVKPETLEQYGAVSSQVAKEMVLGVINRFGTDVAISVTGIAGPDGGSKEKPVGLVYIGIGVNERIEVYSYNFSGNRSKIRQLTVKRALIALKGILDEEYGSKLLD